MNSKRRIFRWAERGGFMLVGALIATSVSGRAEPTADTIYRKLEILAEVIGLIDNQYVDPISATDLVYGAVHGTVSSLDPHSSFFPPDAYKSLVDVTEGEYAGIGVEIEERDSGTVIATVLDDSPAASVGLRAGDIIVAVDGEPVDGHPFDHIHQRLRGPVGSKVTLKTRRAGPKRLRTYTLVRSWVRISPLEHRSLGKGVHYVRLKSFPRRVSSDLGALLAPLKAKGLVIDLRNNPGGLFDEAVEVSDLFLEGGLVVTAIGKGGRVIEQREARETATQGKVPVALLINGSSASAAEIVAGALKDRKRARLFGQRSFGKGSVQSILDLSDGSGLKLTVARYVSPAGVKIDGHGVEPHVATRRAGPDGDPALEEAVAWLRGKGR